MSTSTPEPAEDDGPVFVFDVDETTYKWDRPKISGSEAMKLAGVDSSVGLVQILEDGTTQTVRPDDIIHLVPGVQFKRRPRFQRG